MENKIIDKDHVINELIGNFWVSCEDTPEEFEQRPEINAARAALQAQPSAPANINAIRWDLFPSYLLDHCEGDTITEEYLQGAVIGMMNSDDYKRITSQSATPADMPASDACQVCSGANGGVPGNENIINGVVMCDYCSAAAPKECATAMTDEHAEDVILLQGEIHKLNAIIAQSTPAAVAPTPPDVSELRRFAVFEVEDGIYEHQFGSYWLFRDVCDLITQAYAAPQQPVAAISEPTDVLEEVRNALPEFVLEEGEWLVRKAVVGLCQDVEEVEVIHIDTLKKIIRIAASASTTVMQDEVSK